MENELPPSVILAERRVPDFTTISSWNIDDMAALSPRTIDELLAGDSSFSLFRRQSAIFANPTTTGISIGNTGASATSRTVVLRDGIPQNDPFGGWVSWTRYDTSTLSSARIASAAESVIWGNMSTAGSIHLTSKEIDVDSVTLRAIFGSQGTLGGSITANQVSENGDLSSSIHLFSFQTDGFYSLKQSQRGSVDQRLDLDYAGIDLRLKWEPQVDFTLEAAFSFYEEQRGNGTVLSRNDSQAFDFSLRATQINESSKTQYLAYYQHRDFSSVFAAVTTDRNSERVALNQYDVPGVGYGGAIVQHYEISEKFEFSTGLDFRSLDGETNEDAGTFRRRNAGGQQAFVGIFGQAKWTLNDKTWLSSSLRLDHWSFSNGFRRERSLSSGAALRSNRYPDRSSFEPSASIALHHQVDDHMRAWISLGSSFRAPTINELYRPFRVRSDVTEANPELDPERFFTLEAGLEWQHEDTVKITSKIYHHWIQDTIANVPVTDANEISQIFGTLPLGGTGSQRQNVDEASVLGIHTSIEYMPSSKYSLRLDGLWSHSQFNTSTNQRSIENKTFPQSPDLRLIGSLTLKPTEDYSLFIGAEYSSAIFDDIQGQRKLPSYWTCRLGANWQFSESLNLNLRVENLFDQEIPTGLSSNDLRSVGQPRAYWIAAEYSF